MKKPDYKVAYVQLVSARARRGAGGRVPRPAASALIRSAAREGLGFRAQLSQGEEAGWGAWELLGGHPCRAFELGTRGGQSRPTQARGFGF